VNHHHLYHAKSRGSVFASVYGCHNFVRNTLSQRLAENLAFTLTRRPILHLSIATVSFARERLQLGFVDHAKAYTSSPSYIVDRSCVLSAFTRIVSTIQPCHRWTFLTLNQPGYRWAFLTPDFSIVECRIRAMKRCRAARNRTLRDEMSRRHILVTLVDDDHPRLRRR